MDEFAGPIQERYEPIRLLHSTALSRIYRATQKSTGQEVAIKVMAADHGSAAETWLLRFEQEARFCAALHHPNIVPLLESGRAATGEPFAVFSFVPGMDLGSVLVGEGRLDVAEAIHLMMQVVDALACAHARGIVHRDLKPENIMVNPAGGRRNALVLDFGIGALVADSSDGARARLTQAGEYLGTPAYSAPEQLLGGAADFRSDLYAWGLIFLECLTGRPLMNGLSPHEVIHRHLGPEPIAIPLSLEGTALGDLLQLVTQKNLDDRRITAAEALSALQSCSLEGLPTRLGNAPSERSPSNRPPSKLSSTWLVPQLRNTNFIGREKELAAIRASLRTSRLLALVALHGLGGVGKTQLALEYAYRHASDYRLVAWVHAEQAETVAAGYNAIGRALQLPATPNEREAIEAVRTWLERNDRWLLIFDNVQDPAAVRPYLPRSQTGHMLVTSRHQSWRGLAASLPVNVLPRDEAVDFLLQRTGETDAAQAEALSDELGALPLALEEAAAYIEATGRTIASYLPLLRVHRGRVLGSPSDPLAAVQTTWELSFREIERWKPASLELLKLCAFFAPDDIPRALLRSRGDGGPESLRAVVGDEVALDECIAALRRYSLVRTEGDALSLHRLVQLATRERISEGDRKQWTTAALSLIEAAYPADSIAGDSSREPGRLLPHASSVLAHAGDHESDPQLAARVLRRTGIYLSARGLHDRARERLERALALFERAPEPDVAQIGGTLWELGMVLYALGEPEEARVRLGAALGILPKGTSPAALILIPQSLIALAWVLRTLGRYEETLATSGRCLQLIEARVGPRHRIVAMSLALMARANWSLNRIGEARANLARAHDVLKTVEDDLALISGTWYALAQVHFDLGELDAAFDCATRGIAVGEPSYGRDHPLVVLNVVMQGCVHARRGELAAARRALESALESGRRTCHRLHEDMAAACWELANVHAESGDGESAIRHLRHALAGIKDLCGDTARVEGQTRIAFAGILRRQGQPSDAVAECRAGLALIETRFGATHPLRVGGLNMLGWALDEMADRDGAEAAFTEALGIAAEAGMHDSPDYAESLEGLGVLQLARGDRVSAVGSFTRSLRGMKQSVGDEHPASVRLAERLQRIGS
jgi:serine/threonine protein kinase/tetratricopeptide (TPR) repeat protein